MVKTNSIFGTGFLLLAVISIMSVIPNSVYAETISVSIDGTSYDIEYMGTNVTVNGVDADLDFTSLIFSVDVSDNGTLEIILPRNVMDSEFNGVDEDFIIVADGGLEAIFTETETTQTSRTLEIDLESGTDEVEVIGTIFGREVTISEEPDEPNEEPTEEPVVCTTDYTPVCGVDGNTYSNMCNLNAANIDLDHSGECKLKVVDEPPEEDPEVICGEGTILQDGLCVLETTCGEGTILQDGLCVLDESQIEETIEPQEPETKEETSQSSGPFGVKGELVYGAAAAFVIAFIVMIILWLMSRASRSKD